MMGLSDGRKTFRIGLAVLIQYRSVTDTQPATQPPSHVAVAITLNAGVEPKNDTRQGSNPKSTTEVDHAGWAMTFSPTKISWMYMYSSLQ